MSKRKKLTKAQRALLAEVAKFSEGTINQARRGDVAVLIANQLIHVTRKSPIFGPFVAITDAGLAALKDGAK